MYIKNVSSLSTAKKLHMRKFSMIKIALATKVQKIELGKTCSIVLFRHKKEMPRKK